MHKFITPTTPLPKSKTDWDDYYLLLVVGQTGSLRRAAEIVGQTAPTIARRLEILEGRLGVQLIVKGVTGVALTEEGLEAADSALTMLRQVSALEERFAKQDREVAGEVTLCCGEALAAPFLAPSIVSLTQPNPKLHVKLITEMPIPEPGSGDTDIAIQYFEGKNVESVGKRLGTIHYCLFGSQAYFDMYGPVETALDQVLEKHRVIGHTAYRSRDPNFSDRAESVHSLVKYALTTDTSAGMVEMVANGAGLGMMPSYAPLYDDRLIMVNSPPLAKVPFYLVYRDAMRDAPRIKVVAEWIKSVFKRAKNPWFRDEFVHPKDFGDANLPRNTARL